MYEGLVGRLQELARRAGLRDVPTAVLLAAACVSVAIVGWALWHWWPHQASDEIAFESGELNSVDEYAEKTASSSEPLGQEATGAPATVVIHVVGCVRHPGVYDLPAGSRVVDAVESAGGTLPDAVLNALNMARVLADGEQILVPDEDDPSPAPSGQASGPSATDAPGGQHSGVNINAADVAALEALPGVGPATAAKIVADRETNGPYSSVDDLTRVSGIGPKKLEQLREFARVQ